MRQKLRHLLTSSALLGLAAFGGDVAESESGLRGRHSIPHPDVHLFAAHVAHRVGATHVIELGCERGQQLARMAPTFSVIGLDQPAAVANLRATYGYGEWLPWEPDGEAELPPTLLELLGSLRTVLPTNVVICADVLDRVQNPTGVLTALYRLMEHSPAGVVTAGGYDLGDLRALLEDAGLRVDFVGRTLTDDHHPHRDTTMAILANNHAPALAPAPSDYRVLAIIAVYNEQDVIVPSLRALIDQGVEVHLVDNWSTDATVELARPLLGAGVTAIERFPANGPPNSFQLAALLNRKEEIATEVEANWYLNADADEIRRSPWPGVSLRDALYHVDRVGYNAVDHNLMQFHPINNGHVAGTNFEEYFPYFLFDNLNGYQVKAWKNTGQRVMLVSGGHVARFPGRRVYPYNFVYKHYAVRSQSHGEQKIFRERQERFDEPELAKGWHTHNASIPKGHSFLRDPASLLRFETPTTYEMYMVELLASIGPDARRQWSRRPIMRRIPPPIWRRAAKRAYRLVRR